MEHATLIASHSKSVGVGVMDSAISALILAKAEQLNLGSLVDF